MSTGNYVTNVAAAISGYEGFTSNHPDAPALYKSSMIFITMYLAFILLFAYGAASLSYNYNVSIGTSGELTLVYSILAFVFSSFYYVYYALFLNPLSVKVRARR